MHLLSMTKLLLLLLAMSLLGACANSGAAYRPVVDTKGIDLNKYQIDLAECQQYAHQTAGAGESALGGAAAGAIFGALLATAARDGSSKRGAAGIGAVSAAAGAGAQGEMNQRDVIRRCMNGRGYKVLQ